MQGPKTEYLLRQAKKSYIQSIKASNVHWDTKHNLDRLLTMLPSDPTPGVGDSDSPGLINGKYSSRSPMKLIIKKNKSKEQKSSNAFIN